MNDVFVNTMTIDGGPTMRRFALIVRNMIWWCKNISQFLGHLRDMKWEFICECKMIPIVAMLWMNVLCIEHFANKENILGLRINVYWGPLCSQSYHNFEVWHMVLMFTLAKVVWALWFLFLFLFLFNFFVRCGQMFMCDIYIALF
jgi:hypothetical protein